QKRIGEVVDRIALVLEGGPQQQLDVGEQKVEHRQAGGEHQLKARPLKGERDDQVGRHGHHNQRHIGCDTDLEGGDKVALLLLVAALLRAVAQGGLGDAQAVKEHDVVADVVHIGQQPVVGLGKKARQKKHRDKARDL